MNHLAALPVQQAGPFSYKGYEGGKLSSTCTCANGQN